jgi:L-arginine dehydrogenase
LTLFPDGSGDFITYQGVMADAGVFGAKLSPYIVQSGAPPLITAWTMLMSMTTGRPLLLCDAAQLTTERTAGVTALAVDLLAPADARRLSIVGTGALAEAHLRHVLLLRDWDRVRVVSRHLGADSGAAKSSGSRGRRKAVPELARFRLWGCPRAPWRSLF